LEKGRVGGIAKHTTVTSSGRGRAGNKGSGKNDPLRKPGRERAPHQRRGENLVVGYSFDVEGGYFLEARVRSKEVVPTWVGGGGGREKASRNQNKAL